MEPRATNRDRKLHLSYDLTHRIRCAAIYPIAAPNGSTLLIYGHDRGIRLLWRGGRKVKQTSAARANNASQDADVILIDDDDEPSRPEQEEHMEYEETEEELDPDCPYPGILHELNISLPAPILRLAIPSIPATAAQKAPELQKYALVATADSSGRVRLLRIPLEPRPSAQKYRGNCVQAQFTAGGGPIHDLAIKLQFGPDNASFGLLEDSEKAQILLAASTGALNLWKLPLSANEQDAFARKIQLASASTNISFHPSPRSSQLLLADQSGFIRIFDPSASSDSSARPTSRGSTATQSIESGKWLSAFTAPFAQTKPGESSSATCKKVLGVNWVLHGRCILALFDDGQWGVWDITGSAKAGKSVNDFVLQGYLGSASTSESPEPMVQKRGGSKLAPMTPNTRKAKSETLFGGTPKVAGTAVRGGISISRTDSLAASAEESVMFWYGSEVYAIPNMQAFWQRSLNSEGGSGGLYSPGIAHVQDINTMNEHITSIAQFHPNASNSGLGQLNTQRDFLVSAEHRFIISQTVRPPTPAKSLFQKAAEQPIVQDQRMLDSGDLDIGGLDRMLDSMAGDNRTRRVGFAVH